MKQKGRFITFEGGEGAGKSTQLPFIKNFLQSQGYPVLITREPGGTEGAELIRSLLVQGPLNRWDGVTEYLLLSAARRDHLEKIIKPTLASGTWVLCDRFFDSSLAYQGAGQGLDPASLTLIYHFIADNFEPDLTFIFDLPPEIGLKRALERGEKNERFEQMEVEFHQRVYEYYQKLLQDCPNRCRRIDASRTPVEMTQELQYHLLEFLK